MNSHSCFKYLFRLTVVLLAVVTVEAAERRSAGETTNAGNRRILDLPPAPGNPRNSEGAFLDLRDGRIILVYSRFTGVVSLDHAKAELAARFSSDAGETWSTDTLIATPGEKEAMNVMSVSLLRLQNGDVGLFYLLRRSFDDMRMFLRRSSDEGRTWGAPVNCMPAAGYYGVNNDRVIRLSSGRIIIPAALHRKRADRNEAAAIDSRALAVFFLSDDDGRTWREGTQFCTLAVVHTKTGLQEPGVVELASGGVWAWARTDLGRQYEFFSWDGGESWSQPGPSRFSSPRSPLSMKRLPGSNGFFAVWNPIPEYETPVRTAHSGRRAPLVIATGAGPSEKWKGLRVIEGNDGVDAGYCYTAIHFTKDAVLLAYCAGAVEDKHSLARLRITKLPLAGLTD